MLTKKDYRYFKVAESVAHTSEFPRIHIGAVIVLKNEIISVGVNKLKTHPMQKKYNVNRFDDTDMYNNFIHAEIDAIVKVRHLNLRNASMYIFRKNNNGELAICRPCEACMACIKSLGIKNIYYTTNEGYCYEYIDNIEVEKCS